jgi:hypothetical protein
LPPLLADKRALKIGTMSTPTYYYLNNNGQLIPTNNIGDFFTNDLKILGISGLATMNDSVKLGILKGIFEACFNQSYRIIGWAFGSLSDVFYFKKSKGCDLLSIGNHILIPGDVSIPKNEFSPITNQGNHPFFENWSATRGDDTLPHDVLQPPIMDGTYKPYESPPFNEAFLQTTNLHAPDTLGGIPLTTPPFSAQTYPYYDTIEAPGKMRPRRLGNLDRSKINARGRNTSAREDYDSTYLEQYTDWVNEVK